MIDGLPDPLPVGIRNSSIGSVALPATTSTEFLGPSPNRVGLLIFLGTGPNVCINNRPIAAQTDGLQYQPGTSAITLNRDEVGDIIKKPWFAFATGAGTISWLEVLEG